MRNLMHCLRDVIIIKKNIVLVFIIAALMAIIVYYGYGGQKFADTQTFQMGTFVDQKVYGRKCRQAINDVSARIAEIEQLMTINAPSGEINILNEYAGMSGAKLSPETMQVIEKSIIFSELSDGAFDITVAPLVKAWGISSENPTVPEESNVHNLLKLVNYKDIDISRQECSVMLKRPGQMVDLGGIAKGYAGDETARIYKSHGISSGFINIGGNIVALGNKPDGTPWKVAVKNPRPINEPYIGTIDVNDTAVATSGDYERFFEHEGKRYHHIIDPKTGYPADSGLISVTVVAQNSIDADALSTALFILGLDKGMRLIRSMPGIEAIFVTKDKKIHVTQGLKQNFIFNTEVKDFEYVE